MKLIPTSACQSTVRGSLTQGHPAAKDMPRLADRIFHNLNRVFTARVASSASVKNTDDGTFAKHRERRREAIPPAAPEPRRPATETCVWET